jgi:hypothetical protein
MSACKPQDHTLPRLPIDAGHPPNLARKYPLCCAQHNGSLFPSVEARNDSWISRTELFEGAPMGFQPTPGSDHQRAAWGNHRHQNLYQLALQRHANRRAIHVKHGDWLSKYSAAMYNDFTHVHEFGRMDKNGLLRPIHKVNLIFAGETVYHIPTYRKTHPMRMGAIEVTVSPLTAEQKKKVVLDTLKHEYYLQGERREWLDHAAHIAHGTDTAVEIAEVASLIAEGTAAATALQLMAAVLTPIMIGIAILNAADTDKRLAGMQARSATR